jgi:hypothetical protein
VVRRLAILVAGLASLLVASPGLASTITTVPSWNGSDQVSPFGYPNTATYGQVVQGTGEDLQSFTVYLDLPTTTTFRGGLYGWDGSKASTELWTGADANTAGGAGFEPVTFTLPAGVTLDAGTSYVVFATTTMSSGSGTGKWGLVLANAYPDGTMVYKNDDGGGASELTTANWGTLSSYDLAFTVVLVVSGAPRPVWRPLPVRGAYCVGSKFYDLLLAQPGADSTYEGAAPAIFVKGKGVTCDPPPAGYVRNGYAGEEYHVPADLYPFYEPAGS